MTIHATYTKARANLASLFDSVTNDQEVVIIQRRGAADELQSLLETAHLLRSPVNAERLLTALNRAQQQETPPQSIADLGAETGLG